MLDRERIRGVIPPLVTPMTPDEELDEPGLRRLIRRLLKAGIHGVFMLGGSGEGIYVTDAVQARAIDVAADEVAGRAPVLAGVTELSIKRAIEKGKQAARLGADVLISMVPYQRPMPQEHVYDYFVALAEGTGMPVMMYNIPYAVPTNIKEETIVRLAEHPLIYGMKDSDNHMHISRVLMLTKGTGFRLLCGIEHNLLAGMMEGAVGGTLATANLWPEITVETYDACAAADWPRALALQRKLDRFTEFAFQVPLIPSTKYALALMGIIASDTMARPARTLSADEQRQVKEWLIENGLLG